MTVDKIKPMCLLSVESDKTVKRNELDLCIVYSFEQFSKLKC